ncbi:MAG: DUF2892 domain-containing protein [Ignavibacteriaceae bacterium]|nr:DUF2892 domain-containing protein [Ignavibacterium sp.]MCC6253383.1 DUF2892 domain-containing protein [Ignavibacteriaceae bacterium]HMN23428.1 DUF2892 domain-containing protein [Ignavibacteriaceae bacterium]HRN26528.1 DUF2892 domain-containing protein [Ignavibacteriaceae bacterium]HRP92196.1 DUF2892 domain-containing protein [Ignavibacteriaceae bacterium]
MKTNVGSADRIVRFVIGIVIIALGFYFKSWWGVIGIFPIITAYLNFCPVFKLLGVNSKKKIETEKLKN